MFMGEETYEADETTEEESTEETEETTEEATEETTEEASEEEITVTAMKTTGRGDKRRL